MFFEQGFESLDIIISDHNRTVEFLVGIEFNNRRGIQCFFYQLEACGENVVALRIQNFHGVQGKGIVIQKPLVVPLRINN